jgi:putative ABC transport system permease protein
VVQDLRFALRLIAKERWFSAAAIIALALGIGVNATGFTLVSGVFLRERSLRDANQVYALSWRVGTSGRFALSHPDFEDWRAASRSFAYLAAINNETMNISDDRELPEQVFGARITADAFAVFEQQPRVGRAFTPDDLRRGAAPVAIIAHHIWKNRYRGDAAVLGSTLRIDGTAATIVGVMPDGIRFPGNAAVWAPFIPTAAQESRSNRQLRIFGRLKAEVSRREAETEAAGIAQRLIAAYPEDTKGFAGFVVESIPERFVGGPARPMFLALMVAVSFVLLIACANVANLLLSRSVYRAREVAIRMALGATRRRVVRQLLIESVVLGGAGGALGLVLASGGVRLFDAAVLDPTRPYFIVFAVDYAVFGYVAAVCVITAIIAGLAPALHVSGANSNEVLKEGARGSVGGLRTRWFSSTMVVSQLALTIILLTGAGLMVRSFYNLRSADNGYSPEGLLAMRLQLPNAKYATPDLRRAFYDRLESDVHAVPGIETVAITTAVPPTNNEQRRLEIDGRVPAEQPPLVSVVRIGPRFFDVLGRGLLRGRALQPLDAAVGSEGVLVNERLARQLFANEDPVGRRVRFVQPPSRSAQPASPIPPAPWRTIVGISPAVRHSSREQIEPDPVVYVPYAHEPPSGAWVMVRTQLPPGSVFEDIRRAVQTIDRDQPVFTIQTLQEFLREQRWPYTAFGGAFAIFAMVALILSSVGLYALMAYSVTQRTQEIGVRMAVGARGRHVSWLFLKRGLLQLAIGLTLGLAGAFALSGVLRGVLVDVTPGDPLTFLGVTGVLTAVAIAACLLPVYRATRIDPLVALRQE